MFKSLKFAQDHKIKVASLQSMTTDDGLAWSAEVILDGKKVGSVANDGRGGHPKVRIASKEDFDTLVELYYKASADMPEINYLGKNVNTHGQDAAFNEMRIEALIGMIVDETEMLKKIRTKCKKNTLVRLRGDDENEYRIIKNPFSIPVKNALAAQHDIVEFLNETVATL